MLNANNNDRNCFFYTLVCHANTCVGTLSFFTNKKKKWYEWANVATADQCGLDWMKSFFSLFFFSLSVSLCRHSFLLCAVFWHFIFFFFVLFNCSNVSHIKRIKVWAGLLSLFFPLFFFHSYTKVWTRHEVTQITVDEQRDEWCTVEKMTIKLSSISTGVLLFTHLQHVCWWEQMNKNYTYWEMIQI